MGVISITLKLPACSQRLESPYIEVTTYPVTAAAPYRIAIAARPRGNDWLCDEVSAFSREGIDTLVSMLTDEEAEELGLEQESA